MVWRSGGDTAAVGSGLGAAGAVGGAGAAAGTAHAAANREMRATTATARRSTIVALQAAGAAMYVRSLEAARWRRNRCGTASAPLPATRPGALARAPAAGKQPAAGGPRGRRDRARDWRAT